MSFVKPPHKELSKSVLDLRFMIMRAEKTRNIKKRQQNFVPRFLSVRLLGVAAKGTGGSKVFFFGGVRLGKNTMFRYLQLNSERLFVLFFKMEMS